MDDSVEPTSDGPSPAAVPGNRWDLVPVDGPLHLTPRLSVAVVIPSRDSPRLRACVAALVNQTYPRELVSIVVVDDASTPPVGREDLGEAGDGAVSIVRTDGEGFGAGRARNAGADAVVADVVIFIDADVIASPEFIAAHARWHHRVTDAVVVGRIRQVADGDLSEASLVSPDVHRMLEDLPWSTVEWSTRMLERTDRLRHDRPDVWAYVVGANVSLTRQTFLELGGFTPYGRRGIEDTELGYRAFINGCIIVPDDEAVGWHPARRHFDRQTADRTKRRRRELIADEIALPPFRRRARTRTATVPRIEASVRIVDERLEEVIDCVDGLLAGSGGDITIRLLLDEEHVDLDLIREGTRADARVQLNTPPHDRAPVQVSLPVLPDVAPGALERLCAPVLSGAAGQVIAVRETGEPVVAVARRAAVRARRLGTDDGTDIIERLFGSHYESAAGIGLEPPPPEVAGASESVVAQESKRQRLAARNHELIRQNERLQADLQRLRSQIEALRHRRVVQIADRVGRFVRTVRG